MNNLRDSYRFRAEIPTPRASPPPPHSSKRLILIVNTSGMFYQLQPPEATSDGLDLKCFVGGIHPQPPYDNWPSLLFPSQIKFLYESLSNL